MSLIEKGFDISYEVQKMGLIKVGGSGKMVMNILDLIKNKTL